MIHIRIPFTKYHVYASFEKRGHDVEKKPTIIQYERGFTSTYHRDGTVTYGVSLTEKKEYIRYSSVKQIGFGIAYCTNGSFPEGIIPGYGDY